MKKIFELFPTTFASTASFCNLFTRALACFKKILSSVVKGDKTVIVMSQCHNYQVSLSFQLTHFTPTIFTFRVRVLLKSAVIRLLIIKLLLLNYHVRPPIKIPKLNTTFPITLLLSKPVVTDSFRIM